MKLKQTKVMLFLLTLVFTLIFRPSEARLDPSLDPNHLCSDDETTPVANLPGCFYAVRLAADQDIRWLSRDCCEAVKTLPDCLLLVFPYKALNTIILKRICVTKFPG
ncbi:hypothetical protein AtNW77_Chr3g0155591 [Arabidopsis thaliana]|uniref:ECA1-like gametogenesis related family protein n=2 Tax=Arabidopsis TaxID=3701 RepID=Q2V3Z5_ARATH|nr:ECA1-like gametogenesis related family protein [Arabidopsis thaliana]AEE73647.2 ECA1-like gametogenesis related family protein [Arabidopsis thaliana]|eukprot:NP_001030615.2 ECA1-like gametogenesis related family protein [Arabidopsis thaliana]